MDSRRCGSPDASALFVIPASGILLALCITGFSVVSRKAGLLSTSRPVGLLAQEKPSKSRRDLRHLRSGFLIHHRKPPYRAQHDKDEEQHTDYQGGPDHPKPSRWP